MKENATRNRGLSARSAAVLGVAAALVVGGSLWLRLGMRRFGQGTVRVGDGPAIRVDVADTELSRERGLSGRDGLADGQGMYFVFPAPAQYSFWMKGMRFPIDIVWVADGKVADITVDVPPPGRDGLMPTYAPRVPVDRVLELPAGHAQAHGLRIGMPVFESFDYRN